MKNIRRATYALVGMFAIAACSAQNGLNPATPTGTGPNALVKSSAGHKATVKPLCGAVSFGYARCFAIVRTDVKYTRPPQYVRLTNVAPANRAQAAATGYYGPLDPAHLQAAYRLPSAKKGKGQTVGIVDAYDDPTAESDLAAYRADFGLPPCTTANGCFRKLNQSGKAAPLPPGNAGWAGEISLDLDMVSAICPNCNIVLIEANSNQFNDLGKSVLTAGKAGAGQISNSYGGGECGINSSGQVQCQSPATLAKFYNIPNVIITASSGDSTWFAGPQAPADFGTVVSVGGTSIYPDTNKRGWTETAWTGAGSSCSHFINNPSWIPLSISCPKGKRPIADVSAVADPFTGVLVYQTYPYSQGGLFVYGGTSVSSPIIASVYALAGNSSTQNFGAMLYTAPSGTLNDVVIGKNGIPGLTNDAGQSCTPILICASMPGYDGPTGNGTPNGVGAF